MIKLGQKSQELLRYLTSFFETKIEGGGSLSVQLLSDNQTDEQALFIQEQATLLESLGLLETTHSVKDLGMSKKERELEGSFYTPSLWAKKAHELLSDIPDLENYVIWDASCGTGNLLIDFPKCKHLYLSTLHEEDVILTRERFAKERPDLEVSVFQLNYLGSVNSPLVQTFSEGLPVSLQEVLANNEKLIILMNPPYSTKGLATGVAEVLSKLKLKSYIADLYTQFMWQTKDLVEFYGLTNTELVWMVPASLLLGHRTHQVRFDYASSFEFKGGFFSPLADFQGSTNVQSSLLCTTRWSTKKERDLDLVNLVIYDSSGVEVGQQSIYLKTERETVVSYIKKKKNRDYRLLQELDTKGAIVSPNLSQKQWSPLGVYQFSSLSYLSLAKNLMTTCELFSMDTRVTRSILAEDFPILTYLFAMKFLRDIPIKLGVSQTKFPVFDEVWDEVYPNLVVLYFVNRELYSLSLRGVGYKEGEDIYNPFFFVSSDKVKQAILENQDEKSRSLLLVDYDQWASTYSFPEFYKDELENALNSPSLLPLFKEVYEDLEAFYLYGLRNRLVDETDKLTNAVDLGFHQLKGLKNIESEQVKGYLNSQIRLKAVIRDLLISLNYKL